MELFYINGIEAPKINVYRDGYFDENGFLTGAILQEQIYMPKTHVEGQPESYESIEDTQLLESDEIVRRVLGYRFRMFMYYNDLMRGGDVLAYIKKLYNYKAKDYVFEVFPNSENLIRRSYMYLVSDLNMKTDRYADDADGIENIILEWESRFTKPELLLYDPGDIWTTLDNFITQ